MIATFIPGGIAFLVSLAATPLVRRLALRLGATDQPGTRRVNARPIPRAGGVAVAVAATVAWAVSAAPPGDVVPGLAAGFALIVLIGLLDDLFTLRPRVKLLGQIAAAVLATAGGLRLGLFEGGGAHATLDLALTILWIVLITNALNLTDGLDGLAAGIGTIALVWLAYSALHGGNAPAATHALMLVGALLGFLPYNFNPATIFLGDSGSLLVGYAVAVLPLSGAGGGGLRPLAVFLLVAVPVTDTVIAIARRFCSRCLRLWGEGYFWSGIAQGIRNTVNPDRRHIHHRLLDLGFSQRRAVLTLYVAAATTGGLAYLLAESPASPVDLFAMAMGFGVITLVRTLGIDELRPARSGVLQPILSRVGRHRRIVAFIDLCLVTITFAGARLLTIHHSAGLPAEASAIAVMATVQLTAFVLLGIYRTAWEATGIADLGLLLRAAAAGALGGYAALRVLQLPAAGTTAVVYFALLVPALILMRFSYLLVANAVRGMSEPERALICGTASEARHVLGRLRRNETPRLEPIGFVELRPRWQGNQVARLPVLGTLDTLAEIVRQHEVHHLVIADPQLQGQSLTWVRAVCRQLDVHVHHYIERLMSDAELAGIPGLAPELRAQLPRRDAAETRAGGRQPAAGHAGARIR